METDWKTFFNRLYEKGLYEEDILSTAAQVAFYFMFALFPLLLFLISLFGIILVSADDLRGELFAYLAQVMPSSAFDLVKETVVEVTRSSSGGKLTIGLLIALWSASAGVDSIRTALNSVYNLEETRPWWKTKLLSLSVTLALAVLLTVALGIIFYGSKFLSLILETINLPISSPVFLIILQWLIILAVLVILTGILYNFLPNHEPFEWVWITPGAIVSIVLWLLLSYAFQLYLSYFDTYAKTYGSLGAVIILMLWLYLTALVILIGGIINAVLEETTDPEAAAKAAEKSIIKLEQAKAASHSGGVQAMIEQKSEELPNKDDKSEKTDSDKQKDSSVAAAAPPEKREISSDKTSSPADALPETNPEEAGNKTAIGITVAGVFGFLMGFLFKKKDD